MLLKALILIFFNVLCAFGSFIFVETMWNQENVFPAYFKDPPPCELLAFKALVFIMLPLGFSIILTSLTRILDMNNSFKQINDKILEDHTQQSFLFVVNYIAARGFNMPCDRILVVAGVFVVGRVLFNFGCVFGAYLQLPELKIPGSFITIFNTLFTMYFNLNRLLIS
jgi:hypothetical protein